MLRRLRRTLREIRYYSAIRQSSGWSRAADVALAFGLVAALPVMLSLDRGVIDRHVHSIVTGKLFRLTDGSLWGATTATLGGGIVPSGATPYGSFDLQLVTDRGGWPFASSVSPRRPLLTVETFIPRQTLTLDDLAPDAPLRQTIAAASSKTADNPALETLRMAAPGDPSRRVHVRGMAGNVTILSLALAVAAWLMVGLARLVWLPIQGRRLERHYERGQGGLCATCGYDLRGNLFGGRCPECGAVV